MRQKLYLCRKFLIMYKAQHHPIKKTISILVIMAVSLLGSASLYAQKHIKNGSKKGKHSPITLVYYQYSYHEGGKDTAFRYVDLLQQQYRIWSANEYEGKQTIPGYATANTYVDLNKDSVYYQLTFADGDAFYTAWQYSDNGVQWDSVRIDKHTTKYTTNINSNRLEFVMTTDDGMNINPIAGYGPLPGTLKQFIRNGQVQLERGTLTKSNFKGIPKQLGTNVDRRNLGEMQKEKMILTTRVFNKAQLFWHTDPEVNLAGKDYRTAWNAFPMDSVIHYAGGTVVLRRMHFDTLPAHYQLFAELHQYSNGDAYDRTGSIFVIPQGREHTFFEGMYQHPDSLPILIGKDGQRYQGICATNNYLPNVELVRFFTPFGVRFFNNRVQLEGLDWEDEAYYKQEITDLAPYLQGDVWIGAFIGNYDAGGHLITLDIKAYPNDELWETEDNDNRWCLPLINTTNVLEMGGQNYGKIFGTDSITVTFDVPNDVEHLRIRYISTGHGGWGEGDEFQPKENQIFIDGQKRFVHTPWRSDCGTYRELNPVSGNFWNGTSSSDYSRSGWCPGTATQPIYFELNDLKAGRHTLTVAIPQGAPIEGGFSHWNISLILLGDKKAPSDTSK